MNAPEPTPREAIAAQLAQLDRERFEAREGMERRNVEHLRDDMGFEARDAVLQSLFGCNAAQLADWWTRTLAATRTRETARGTIRRAI